jgi:thioredoxin reductase
MGLFPFIGATPSTQFAPPSLLTASGHVQTGTNYASAEPRVFAVGAARAEYGGNVVQAMAEGVGAAEAVSQLLH